MKRILLIMSFVFMIVFLSNSVIATPSIDIGYRGWNANATSSISVSIAQTLANISDGNIHFVVPDVSRIDAIWYYDGNMSAQMDIGYTYGTYGNYFAYYRELYQNNITPGFSIWGRMGNKLVADHPELVYNSTDGTKWVDPDYVWVTGFNDSVDGKVWPPGTKFMEVFAHKIDAFQKGLDTPIIFTVQDWRNDDPLWTYGLGPYRYLEFDNSLKSIGNTNITLLSLGAGMGSIVPASWNYFESDHPSAWSLNESWNKDFLTDGILWGRAQENQSYPYHSAMNLVGWTGAQMSKLNSSYGLYYCLYAGMDKNKQFFTGETYIQRMKSAILASYLTRIIDSDGEECPIKGFILTGIEPAKSYSTYDDLVNVARFAHLYDYLRYAKIISPIMAIPSDMGYQKYQSYSKDILYGYGSNIGLIPFRFVHTNNSYYVSPSEIVVNDSRGDFTQYQNNIQFNSTIGETWLAVANSSSLINLVVFHDGGTDSTFGHEDQSYQSPGFATLSMNNVSYYFNISPDSIMLKDLNTEILGQLNNSENVPTKANISLYQSNTSDLIASSQTNEEGNYNLLISKGIFDIQYNISDFIIKFLSINVTSNLYDMVNYVTQYPSVNKVSFTTNISGNQTVLTYSPTKPNRIKINSTEIPYDDSLSTIPSWNYDETNKIITIKFLC